MGDNGSAKSGYNRSLTTPDITITDIIFILCVIKRGNKHNESVCFLTAVTVAAVSFETER